MTICDVKTLSDAHRLAQESGKRLVIQNGFPGGAVAGEWYQDNILGAVNRARMRNITAAKETKRAVEVFIED